MRWSMRKAFIGLSLLVVALFPIQVHADSALYTIKSRINQLVAVLRDPDLKSDSSME
jgi:hypothetical protein